MRTSVAFIDQVVLDDKQVEIHATARDSVRISAQMPPEVARDKTFVEFFKSGRSHRAQLLTNGQTEWSLDVGIGGGISAYACTVRVFTSRSAGDGKEFITSRTAPRRAQWDGAHKDSLLPILPDDSLGGLPWLMNYETGPVLLLPDTEDQPYTSLINNEGFMYATLPSALREIVMWLAKTTNEETADKATAWRTYIAGLGVPANFEAMSDEEVSNTAARAAAAFSTRHGLAEKLARREARDVYK